MAILRHTVDEAVPDLLLDAKQSDSHGEAKQITQNGTGTFPNSMTEASCPLTRPLTSHTPRIKVLI